jgi:hypothetical protein
MRIVMAGRRLLVPQFWACCLLTLSLGALTGCGNKPASYPWAKDTGTLKTPPPVATRAEPTTIPTTTESTAVVTVSPPPPMSAPSTPAASEPAAPFLPATAPPKPLTSNGGEMLLPAVETIHVEEPKRSPLQFALTTTYMYGSVNGNVQIPRGGANGTSNANRPHLDGIGISTANIADGELGIRWGGPGELFVGAQIIRLSGAAFLGVKTLTTDGVTFPAGARVSSEVDLDWYRVGYRHTIPINIADNGIPDLTFTPWVAVTVLDFNYHLTAPRVAAASRSLTKPGAQIGATFAWRPRGGPLSLEASMGGFPTMNTLPTISVESIYARYHFYEWRRIDFTGLLGVAWEQQEFRDNQPLPNHISVNFGPLLLAGLQIKY